MKIKTLSTDIEIKKYLQRINVDHGGISILEAKGKSYFILIEDLHVGAANILKQDALSIGADVAVPRGTIIAQDPSVDVMIIATKRHLEKLVKKLKAQPFGLKELGEYLYKLTTVKKHPFSLMGIINANDDSFYPGSRFVGKKAVVKIEKMIEDGADIIDIGGVSSRPGAKEVSPQEELERVKDIIDIISSQKLYEKVRFSIDSYRANVVAYALENGFEIVNDITGLKDDAVAKLCGSYNATAVIMHMQGTPKTMQNNPTYEDVVSDVYSFFQTQIKKAQQFGIKDIVLDVGIGFGKSLEHNLELLRSLEHFQTLGYPLLVGASRKSLIDKITPSDIEDRLGGSIAIHLLAYKNGADILRVHDVYEHKQALEVYKAIYE